MFKKSKIPANTLVLTVIIALILAILCSSIVLLAYYNRENQIRAGIEMRLSRNIESAMNLVLADTGMHTTSQTDTLDLFGQQQDSVIIQRSAWGIFEITSLKAISNQFSKQQSFISGSVLPYYMDGCLYLADHKRPLSVTGNTNLIGDVYLSKAGIRPGYINQRGYSNDKLVEGAIKISKENLPVLNEPAVNYLYEATNEQCEVTSSIPFADGDSVVQSFYDSTLYIYSKNELQLNGLTLKGRIVVKSDTLIEAGATTIADDVILMAPVIKFTKGFKGTVQAIATDSLVLEASCTFEYPSALVLLKKTGVKWQNVITIAENCLVDGIIITKCDSSDIFRSYVEISKQAHINGIVYVMGYLMLGGNVKGTVLTDYFIYKTGNIVYENNLIDVTINKTGLSGHFIGSPVFENASRKEIIKWVK